MMLKKKIENILPLVEKPARYTGGEVNSERGAITVMDEFRSGKIGRITLERPRSATAKDNAEVEL